MDNTGEYNAGIKGAKGRDRERRRTRERLGKGGGCSGVVRLVRAVIVIFAWSTDGDGKHDGVL